ncbi:MAG: hypothetical protein SXA11_19710 [Cyanobacteriota bacterium]|nr:hypothetical protein [Cyanobacteriota bacterium]
MTAFRFLAILGMSFIALFPLENEVLIANECVKCSTGDGAICCPS